MLPGKIVMLNGFKDGWVLSRKNFIREIELMKSFEPHPHMLNLIGCIADPNNPMLVSELCELGDLRQILANHKPHNMVVILEFQI